eukprot:SAG22_NODE_11_length_35583_cov_107.128790_20_plen_179_part_00
MTAGERKVLVLGATYGSLFASKLLLAGHHVRLLCLPEEAALINAEGTRVRLPVRGRADPVEIDSRRAPGRLTAAGPADCDPAAFDLVVLAMQEPQYGVADVRALLGRITAERVPCLSIMNMPPLPYLARLGGKVAAESEQGILRGCYTDPSVWDDFDPALMTLASPDPQAFRPPEVIA